MSDQPLLDSTLLSSEATSRFEGKTVLNKSHYSKQNREQIIILSLWYHKVGHVVYGALIGILFSLLGFHMLVHNFSLSAWNRAHIVSFALVWSTATGFASYLSFLILHYCQRAPTLCLQSRTMETNQSDRTFMEHMEYYFALGVFGGFCIACTATDVRFGLPVTQILATIGIACGWALLMILLAQPPQYFDHDKEEEHNEVDDLDNFEYLLHKGQHKDGGSEDTSTTSIAPSDESSLDSVSIV